MHAPSGDAASRCRALLLAAALALMPRAALAADEVSELHVYRGEHHRVQFDADIQRSAVGDPEIAGLTELDNREILVLGKDFGRTTLLIWLQGGEVRELRVSVERDITVLQRALHDIHPDITAEMAPDRDAIVLRGVVPTVVYRIAAEDAARRYLDAIGTGNAGKPGTPVLVGSPAAAEGVAAGTGAAPAPLVEAPPKPVSSGAVIDLIRLADLPLRTEDKIRAALATMALHDVTVSRLAAGDVADPSRDVFVLDGRVPDQTALVRAVTLAAHVVGGDGATDEIQVVADEAGALPVTAAGGGGGGGALVGGSSSSIGFGVSTTAQSLRNRIESNLGRAKILKAAGGRVLSFLEVTDLPQVRVDIRLLEVNRTRLQSYGDNLAVIAGDFEPGTLSPASAATVVQGTAAKSTGTGSGSTDVQNVLAFLDGTLTNEFQLTASRFAIDSTLSLLQSEKIARSLSQPSLTVLSGELAVVKVGGEIPVENTFTPAFGGGTTGAGTFTSVIQEDFGVSLSIRPLIGEDGTVTLDMIPEVTRPDFDLTEAVKSATGESLPTVAKQKRSLRTTARLEDGQTLLVGGLITRDESDTASYTPWLHDIPILGKLFEGFATNDDDMELVIVVHPVVVREPSWQVAMWAFPSTDELLDATVPPAESASSADRGESAVELPVEQRH